MKELFTTGEAAEICRVSQQTIIRCFDSKRLEGFGVPAQNSDEPPRGLIKFMKKILIPLDALRRARKKCGRG